MERKRFAAAVACALALPAYAQEGQETRRERRIVIDGHELLAEAATAKATAEAWRHWGDGLRASLGTMFGDRLGPASVVKGAPYSADVSTEVNQTLADGNVIARKTAGRAYRDGEGRTRQETVVDGEVKSIQLRDPVEGTSVMLLPGTKQAVRMPSFAWHQADKDVKVLRLGEREIRIDNGKVSVDGKDVPGTIELRAGGKEVRIDNGRITIDGKEFGADDDGRKIIVKRLDEGGDGRHREEVRVHVFRGADGKETSAFAAPMPPMPPVPPMHQMPLMPPTSGMPGGRLDGALLRSKGSTTSLGVKEFDGVRAEGKSTVRTIPAGEIGNRNPIIVTSESWYSPELQVTVYSRHSDPRYGETIYRLTGIRRAEPAPELFRVPEDYEGKAKRGRG